MIENAGRFSAQASHTELGGSTVASGTYATAMGNSTTASGNYSTAMGNSTTASGSYSTAMGATTTASGNYSTAMGDTTLASGYAATAMGSEAVASGPASTGMGSLTTASGGNSTAMGCQTVASGWQATTMGLSTTASGSESTAMGHLSVAGGTRSLAAGTRAQALHDGTLVWADYQNADFASTANNQFLVRAQNGVGINQTNLNATLDVNGSVRVNNNDIYLRQGTDVNHGVGYYGSSKPFGSATPEKRWSMAGAVESSENHLRRRKIRPDLEPVWRRHCRHGTSARQGTSAPQIRRGFGYAQFKDQNIEVGSVTSTNLLTVTAARPAAGYFFISGFVRTTGSTGFTVSLDDTTGGGQSHLIETEFTLYNAFYTYTSVADNSAYHLGSTDPLRSRTTVFDPTPIQRG